MNAQADGNVHTYTYVVFLCTFLLEQVFLLGAIAKLGATVVTYPLLVVKVHFFLDLETC